jgi:hypothetical protein
MSEVDMDAYSDRLMALAMRYMAVQNTELDKMKFNERIVLTLKLLFVTWKLMAAKSNKEVERPDWMTVEKGLAKCEEGPILANVSDINQQYNIVMHNTQTYDSHHKMVIRMLQRRIRELIDSMLMWSKTPPLEVWQVAYLRSLRQFPFIQMVESDGRTKKYGLVSIPFNTYQEFVSSLYDNARMTPALCLLAPYLHPGVANSKLLEQHHDALRFQFYDNAGPEVEYEYNFYKKLLNQYRLNTNRVSSSALLGLPNPKPSLNNVRMVVPPPPHPPLVVKPKDPVVSTNGKSKRARPTDRPIEGGEIALANMLPSDDEADEPEDARPSKRARRENVQKGD